MQSSSPHASLIATTQNIDSFLLLSKLCIPELPTSWVPRPELTAKLEAGSNSNLRLVLAPAGYGKTTLVMEWLQQYKRPVAWLSLSPEDRTQERFFRYLLATLRQIIPDLVGEQMLQRVQMEPCPPLLQLMTPLLNALHQKLTSPCVLVLDDAHLLMSDVSQGESTQESTETSDSSMIDDSKDRDEALEMPLQTTPQEALALLCQHAPPMLHIVLTSRVWPEWLTPRWLGQMKLNVIDINDLRFQAEQTKALLWKSLGLSFSDEELATLNAQTEGWATGIQLVGFSMQRAATPSQMPPQIIGNNRYINDFLMQEVYQTQPIAIRRFLLEVSVLPRFSPALCDAVRQTSQSEQLLRTLERRQLFLVSLDSQCQWYRLHPLFQEWLQGHLKHKEPELWQTLHLRAAQWFEQNAQPEEASRHYFLGELHEQGAQMLLSQAHQRLIRGDLMWFLEALEKLPIHSFQTNPLLATYRVCLNLLTSSDTTSVGRFLRAFFTSPLHAAKTPPQTALSQGGLAIIRALKARLQGDYASSIQHATQAASALPDEHAFLRIEAEFIALRGHFHTKGGDPALLDALARLFAQAREFGDLPHLLAINEMMANLWLLKGKLAISYRCCETTLNALQSLLPPEVLPLPTMASLYTAWGEVAYQQNRLEQAEEHLSLALTLAEQGGQQRSLLAARVNLARVFFAQGDEARAKHLLTQVERIPQHADARSIWNFARSIQLSWQFGQRQRAEEWSQQATSQPTNPLTLPQLATPLVLARIFLSQEKWSQAEQQIQHALFISQTLACESLYWEGLLLQMQLRQAQGNQTESLALLLDLLRLTQSENIQRLYLDEGPTMASSLTKLLRTINRQEREELGPYIRQLLDGFSLESQTTEDATPPPTSPPSVEPSSPALSASMYQLDPLSERELEVLAHIAQGYSNKEIAQTLHISLSTIKTHTRRIYSKLGAKNRTQAIQQARQLKLLDDIFPQ